MSAAFLLFSRLALSVFDVHLHIQPWSMVQSDALALIDDPAHAGAAEILSSPDNVLRYLDREGVDRACCVNYVSPDVMGFTHKVNDWIANFTRGCRDRLLPVGSVHPSHVKDALAETRRVLDLGIRMIKIHPPHQLFAPNAYRAELPQLADVYRECQSRRIPVMFHTGTSIFPKARNVFADPMPIDDVAVDFPDLTIILAHAGRPLYGDTAFFLARRHRHVHLDLSGIPPKSLPRYVPRLKEIADKVLWGSDWPAPGVTSLRKNIEEFRGVGYGAEVERKVLWENASRMFSA
jgi:uncharacterized protein